MAKLLEIQTGEKNPILRKKSVKIKKIDSALKKFAKDMKMTMIEKDGLGLAAPQVASNIRMIIVTLNSKSNHERVTIMINPVILEYGEEIVVAEEGCLSLPGQWMEVERFKNITAEYMSLEGETHVLKLDNLNARVIQHEIDHLDGILFIDRVNEKTRRV
jgi:peptide deformylase